MSKIFSLVAFLILQLVDGIEGNPSETNTRMDKPLQQKIMGLTKTRLRRARGCNDKFVNMVDNVKEKISSRPNTASFPLKPANKPPTITPTASPTKQPIALPPIIPEDTRGFRSGVVPTASPTPIMSVPIPDELDSNLDNDIGLPPSSANKDLNNDEQLNIFTISNNETLSSDQSRISPNLYYSLFLYSSAIQLLFLL